MKNAFPTIFPAVWSRLVLSLLFLLSLAGGQLSGQDRAGEVFSPSRLAELRKEVVFTPPEEEEEEEIDDGDAWDFGDGNLFENFNISKEVAYVMLGVLLLLLGVLVYRILGDVELRRRIKGGGEEQDQIMIEEIEEEALVASGVSLSLQERAENAGQFDIAVRLLYIQLLKDLQDNGFIKYRRDYSNRDYQNQMRNSELLGDLKDVTVDYERYWYGKYTIDPLSYRLVKRKFSALTNRVHQAGKSTSAHA